MKVTSLFLFIPFFTSVSISAQSEQDLYKQVFGNKVSSKIIEVPVSLEGRSIGTTKIKVVQNSLQQIERFGLYKILSPLLSTNILKLYQETFSKEYLTKSELRKIKIVASYSPESFILSLSIPQSYKKIKAISISDGAPKWATKAINPKDFSLITNYSVIQQMSNSLQDSDYLRVSLDPSVYYKGFVLESSHRYQENESESIQRKYTRIIKDIPSKTFRITLGDLENPTEGYQVFQEMGGLSITKNFSLNPYMNVTPTTLDEFILEERSIVKVYINDRLVKVEQLDAGKHGLNDLPLNDGFNEVKVEIKNDFGKIKILRFNKGASTDLLEVGLSKFNFSIGLPSQELTSDKRYLHKEGPTVTSFYQIGLTDTITSGVHLQGNKKQSLLGINGIKVTPIGNFNFEIANSNVFDSYISNAARLKWDYSVFTGDWKRNWRMSLQGEFKERRFSQLSDTEPNNRQSYKFNTSFGKDILSFANLSIGANYGLSRDSLLNPYGFNTSVNLRVFKDINITGFYGRSKSDTGRWANTVYAFLNFNLPDTRQYITSFYDETNSASRTSWSYNSPQKINAVNSRINYAKKKGQRSQEAEIEFSSKMSDIKLRHNTTQDKVNGNSNKTALQVKGAYVLSSGGMGLSRSIANSFAIIKPNRFLKGQKLALHSNTKYSEGDSDIFKQIVLTDLPPYHYKKFQFDTSTLDDGYSVGEEEFVLYAGYKTGHILKVGAPGNTTLLTQLTNRKKILPLKTGILKNTLTEKEHHFFSNRAGFIVIENLIPGNYELRLSSNKYIPFRLDIDKNQRGIFKIKEIKLEKVK